MTPIRLTARAVPLPPCPGTEVDTIVIRTPTLDSVIIDVCTECHTLVIKGRPATLGT